MTNKEKKQITNKAKKQSEQDGKKFLQNVFGKVQKTLKSKFDESEEITHDGDKGKENESIFIEILRKYLPNRYAIDSGIVIDSKGETSDQIDIIIFDPQYTPKLLTQKYHRYIPAEAVYAVFEVKPKINKKYLEYAGDKAASVKKLHRTSVPIPYAGGTYPAKPLFNIVSGILAIENGWSDGFGGTFLQNHYELSDEQKLDCGLAVSGDHFDFYDAYPKIVNNNSEQALIYFIFRLLGKLQSLGTVPAIDWNAYAEQILS
ncbi:hypothetical protein Xen7305DRAFT_00026490 [Xenococcus sp. PCC 7305]|uniref:DUF6602 domain-containing protein n=1 Tax=Xenococcus sp. PCC 7305 TaxID=102125 RepID=UPI0002AC383D|nr:DUF6602 domain-containing protein [Xenococcus sp. PCC 7305]ELS02931.1 hypothetical protein Xen7305DRAFT_00026490 [Xenococcus sp. PCC 7305]